MNFQREAVVFAVQRNGRVMLADDMGLGKTVQAIAISTYYRREWPLLVICPSSVRLVWAQALQFWVPSLENNQICVVFSSSNHSTQSLLSHNVIITSYDLGVKMSDCLKACNFKVIITDESHFLKNFKTARCKSILPLLKSASRVLLLSGTPALSRPLELYTQLNAIDRSFGMSYVDFGLRYCNGKSTPFGWDFSGSSHMSELQMYLEQKIMIRRLKQHVMDQLPDKIRQVVAIEHLIANCKELKQMKTHLHHVSTLKVATVLNVLLCGHVLIVTCSNLNKGEIFCLYMNGLLS
jgi:SWI/SNF-related matrix-associated actin-dependent regulator 1 of chromatin subfamily A